MSKKLKKRLVRIIISLILFIPLFIIDKIYINIVFRYIIVVHKIIKVAVESFYIVYNIRIFRISKNTILISCIIFLDKYIFNIIILCLEVLLSPS